MGTKSVSLVFLVCWVVVSAQNNMPEPPNDPSGQRAPPGPPPSTTTPEPTIATEPTTTTAEPTHSSTQTTVTTQTTEEPHTTPENVTTTSANTTIAPTTVPTTTTVAPIPAMDKAGSWNISNGTQVCFKMVMAAQFKVMENHSLKGINLSPNATLVTRKCSDKSNDQIVTLTWDENGNKYTVSFDFHFGNSTDKDDSRQIVVLQNLTFTYDGETVHLLKEDKLLAAHTGYSYKCNNAQTVDLSDNATVTWKQVQVEAYITEGSDFGQAEECSADDTTNDIVPIAVGCALAGLVVIVLIAYVVGRRISRKKGYQSV